MTWPYPKHGVVEIMGEKKIKEIKFNKNGFCINHSFNSKG